VLSDLDALSKELEARLKRVLLNHMRNGYWGSTFDTAQVIFNTRKILSKEAAAAAGERRAGMRTVSVRDGEGVQLGDLSRIPSGFVGSFPEPGSVGRLAEIQLVGLDPLDVAHSTVTADIPFGSVSSASHGLTLDRTLMRITPSGTEPLDHSKPLRKGDVVVSEVRVRRGPLADLRSLPSHFVVVEDGIPSFARTIDEDRNTLADAKVRAKEDDYWAAIKETQRYPDRTVRIAKILPRGGEIRIYQVWQVAFAGKASIPPARAFDMYDESLRGNTDAMLVRAE